MDHQSTPRRLVGQVAIVTAATAGIGLATAERLAREGASVMICSRRKDNVDEAVAALRSKGLEVQGVVCHVASAEHRQRLVDATVRAYGRVDILVSNAAVNPTAGPLLDTPPDALDKLWDVNVKSAILLAAAARPHMRRGGSMVFVSSMTAFTVPFPIAAYGITKTALVATAKALAAELGPDGIRVNALAPGIVPTKFSAALVANSAAEEAQREAAALKRLGTAEDMAAAVAYLVSPDAGYVTGECLVVAGGTPTSRL